MTVHTRILLEHFEIENHAILLYLVSLKLACTFST